MRLLLSVTPSWPGNLLAHLFKHAPCRGVLGMPGEPRTQNLAGLSLLSLRYVKPRQVQVGLIKIGRHPNGFLELLLGLGRSSLAQEEHAEIIERLRVVRAKLQGLLPILEGPILIVQLRLKHPDSVIHLRVVRAQATARSKACFASLNRCSRR